MSTVLHNKLTGETTVFTCRRDLLKKIGRKETTVWKWSQLGVKETSEFIIYFNCTDMKNRNKKGNLKNLRQ